MDMMTKSATGLRLVQWARFQDEKFKIEGSTLFTGVNGIGKPSILYARAYLLTANTQFNKAAKDKERTVLGYVRGDTKSEGADRYLRSGEVVSYIAMEFWSPFDKEYLVVGVCIESASELNCKSSWFICKDARLNQINFTEVEGKTIRFTPKNELTVDGRRLKSADFFGSRNVERVLRALGLRCEREVDKYRSKLLKMMAFNPENNIERFIQDCVLDSGKVNSLESLRELRKRLDSTSEMYENLKKCKSQLELIENYAVDYEKKVRELNIGEMMFRYQNIKEKEEEKRRQEENIKVYAHKLKDLDEKKEDINNKQTAAQKRLRIAENNDYYRDMQESIGALEHQREQANFQIKNYRQKVAALKNLQSKMAELLKWTDEYFVTEEPDKRYLRALAEKSYSVDEKVHAFSTFAGRLQKQKECLLRNKFLCEERIQELESELTELEVNIKRLKASQIVFPKNIEQSRKIIEESLQAMGIRTEVRIFAELVQEIKDEQWRSAIETFLGQKRFNLIVDGTYCQKVMEIVEEKKLHDIKVVITDKLPDTQVVPKSAAAMLEIPNAYARRFANYLLNGIHLCESVQELHEYPLGGLMKNGMLAKSYALSYMKVEKTSFYLGRDAVKLQLEEAQKQKAEKCAILRNKRNSEDLYQTRCNHIESVDWRLESYDFGAATKLDEENENVRALELQIKTIKEDPTLMAAMEERDNAIRECEKLNTEFSSVSQEIGSCKSKKEECENRLSTIAEEIELSREDYDNQCLEHPELKQAMIDEYQKRIAAKNDGFTVISLQKIRKLEHESVQCKETMENAQIEYCRIAATDVVRRGVEYIPFYRNEYREVSCSKIEQAADKLAKSKKDMENSFMNDFVAELNETIQAALAEKDKINNELSKIPFGNDRYRFVMTRKPERQVFFSICDKLSSYLDSTQVYMNSDRSDEEMETYIHEFMEKVLDEEDDEEYTDYRKYFVYNMKIISRQGDREILSDLSKKQGSASGGEKQTPYFIILAAGLIQYYPKDRCCARIAFIDEAFSAMSRERIEQMVKYLNTNGFQVFYAAPQEKISSIGSSVQTTVTLVPSGRYSHAVEGLVKEIQNAK